MDDLLCLILCPWPWNKYTYDSCTFDMWWLACDRCVDEWCDGQCVMMGLYSVLLSRCPSQQEISLPCLRPFQNSLRMVSILFLLHLASGFLSCHIAFARCISLMLEVTLKKNQQTKRVNATSNKHSKDASHLRYLSPGIQVNTRHRSSTKDLASAFIWLFLYVFICFFKFVFRFCWRKPNRLVGSLEIIFIIISSNSSSSSRTYQFI